MPDYLATFRMVGASCPNRTGFAAKDVPEAINKMLASINQTTTMMVEEFEILQVLGDGKYAIAATKNKKETRVEQSPHSNVSSAAKAACVVATTTITEGAYSPYETAEA